MKSVASVTADSSRTTAATNIARRRGRANSRTCCTAVRRQSVANLSKAETEMLLEDLRRHRVHVQGADAQFYRAPVVVLRDQRQQLRFHRLFQLRVCVLGPIARIISRSD